MKRRRWLASLLAGIMILGMAVPAHADAVEADLGSGEAQEVYEAVVETPEETPEEQEVAPMALDLAGLVQGECGNNATWTYASGVLTISGTGSVEISTVTVPWASVRKSIKKIVVNNGITAIGDAAFYNLPYVTSISLPASVKKIGVGAFDSCTRLTKINLPEGITVIPEGAFRFCSSLTAIELPKTVTRINSYAFFKCVRLSSVNIPSGVTWIETAAFASCTYLKNLVLPAGLKKIENDAFLGCKSLGRVRIPSATLLGQDVFYNCGSAFTLWVKAGTDGERYAKAAGIKYLSTPKEPTASVINATGKTLYYSTVAQSFLLNATQTGDGKLSYSSDNKYITVSSLGKVTVKKGYVGEATITIKSAETVGYYPGSKFIKVWVLPADQTITYPTAATTKLTTSAAYSIAAKAKTKLTYTRISGDSCDVTSAGKVTIRRAGTTVVRIDAAASRYYNAATTTMTITVNKATQKITGTTSVTKQMGVKAFSLGMTAKTPLVYHSNNTNVVQVSDTGKVTVVGAGTATITVSAMETDKYQGVSMYIPVTILNPNGEYGMYYPKISVSGSIVTIRDEYGRTYRFKTNSKTKYRYVHDEWNERTQSVRCITQYVTQAKLFSLAETYEVIDVTVKGGVVTEFAVLLLV